MRQTFQSRLNQSGQGLIEYAILLLLTITLVIGGVELAMTAMASNKSSEAAEAGINGYVAINEKRIKYQQSLARYLERLDRELCLSATDCENSDLVSYLDKLALSTGGSDYLWKSYQDNGTTPVFDPSVTATGNYIQVIDVDGGATLVIGIGYSELFEKIQLIDGVLDDNVDGLIDSSDRDGVITSEELYHAIRYYDSLKIDDTTIANEDGNNDALFNIIQEIKDLNPISDADAAGDSTLADGYKIAKYQTLILFEHIRLSTLPLDPRVVVSESVPLLADHDVSLMSNPTCDNSDLANIAYQHGFPGEDIDYNGDGIPDDGVPHQSIGGVSYPAIYLFNPLPIDVASCQGEDSSRGGQSQLSILVGGYGQAGNLSQSATYTSGLPELNQAYYSQYTRICLDASGEYVSCGNAAAETEILKPPGKYCLSDVADDAIDSCPGIDTAMLNTSGYYFWGLANSADPDNSERFQWVYGGSDAPEFRPSIQLLCNDETHQSQQLVGDGDGGLTSGCQNLFDSDDDGDIDNDDRPLNRINTIEVNVRYRSVFESFLAFGMQELQDSTLLPYFYDPSQLRNPAKSALVPIAGSELGPKDGDLPTVKPFKDFRGCYQVNVETNQVSACN